MVSSAVMANSIETTPNSILSGQISALEKKFAELELKYAALAGVKVTTATTAPASVAALSSSPATAEALGNPSSLKHSGPLNIATEVDKEIIEGPLPRVKVVISKRNSENEPIENEEKPQKPKEDDRGNQACILKKIVYSKLSQGINESEIDITNPELWNLLKVHLGWYPYHTFRGSEPVTLYSPFEPFIFCWDELENEAAKRDEDEKSNSAREDLRHLLDTISGGSSGDENLDKYFKIRSTYMKQDPPTIQFTDLWTIFAPGTLIYGKPFQGQDQVFVVKDNKEVWPRKDSRSGTGSFIPWQLDAWSYDWNAGSFGRNCFTLTFDHFDGHLPCTSLPYFPFELHPDKDEIRANLIKRGKKFRKLCQAPEGKRMFSYRGSAIAEKKGFSGLKSDDDADNDDDLRSHSSNDLLMLMAYNRIRRPPPPVANNAKSSDFKSRVMVDYASYYQYGSADGRNGPCRMSETTPECDCADCLDNTGLMSRYRTVFDKNASKTKWDDEQYLICPPRVLGYILQEKQWAQLQVSLLEDIEHDDVEDAWSNRLVLANIETKNLLFDLVHTHTSPTTTSMEEGDKEQTLEVDDIVPGKGKGLVILLYGPPGVGKTSTAETIAVAAKKPLFSVSVADVGTRAKHVESNLSKIFSLATSWQAILLIDEADVFLESRGRGGVVQSTDKNALVSGGSISMHIQHFIRRKPPERMPDTLIAVFLRVLEYYQGIMFLTTNQVAEFDIAIPSRIHVAIQYNSLERDQMMAIFKGFLKKLKTNGLIEDYNEIIDWLEEDVFPEGFDGRQIRNIVTTALSLARADAKKGLGKGKLARKHLKRAFANVKEFKREFQTQMQRYKDSQMKMIK